MKNRIFVLTATIIIIIMGKSYATDIVVSNADSVIKDTLYYAPGLSGVISNKWPRIIIENAGSADHITMFSPATNFLNLISGYRSSERLIISNAGSTIRFKLAYSSDINHLIVSVNNKINKYPEKFELFQNYPNPFNLKTRIYFDLPKRSFVKLKIYDTIGREIMTLVNKELNPGEYSVDLNAKDLPSGVYFYRIETKRFVQSKKLILMR